MKKYILTLIILVSTCLVVAQTKTGKQEKQPTQKEMQDMMKEMQNAMDDMSEEDKKEMEKMGIKMPDLNNLQNTISGVSDADLKKAYENENRIVPEKDAVRIAEISKNRLTNSNIPEYLTSTQVKVLSFLKSASKTKGEEIYQILKSQNMGSTYTGNAAAGLWMMGKVELAVYIMGKACVDDPDNTDNLNNYASMLSMSGAEQMAIPILNNLNEKFPKNSTLLNNLGQAWFGLGDIDKAEKYLDSTISIYAYHPQANVTKSYIEENKGNTNGAIQAAKNSIVKYYTLEKENRLDELNYELKSNDLSWNQPRPQDPLGLHKVNPGPYPKSVEECEKAEIKWAAIQETGAILLEKQESLEANFLNALEARTNLILKAGQGGAMVPIIPFLSYKAHKKLSCMYYDNTDLFGFNVKKQNEALQHIADEIEILKERLGFNHKKIELEFKDKFGEGKENPFEAYCKAKTTADNEFLNAANTMLEQGVMSAMKFYALVLNDKAYYDQYTMWEEDFELSKHLIKQQWLSILLSYRPQFLTPSCKITEETELPSKKLLEFDDIHCMYHSMLTTPVGTITTDCSKMVTTLDLKIIKGSLKQDLNKVDFGDQFISCTIEVHADKDVNIGVGEASVGGNVAFEFDRTGLKEVVIEAGIEVKGSFSSGPLKTEGSVNLGVMLTLDGDGVKDAAVIGSAEIKTSSTVISEATKETIGGNPTGLDGGFKDVSANLGVKSRVSLISGKSDISVSGFLSPKNP